MVVAESGRDEKMFDFLSSGSDSAELNGGPGSSSELTARDGGKC